MVYVYIVLLYFYISILAAKYLCISIHHTHAHGRFASCFISKVQPLVPGVDTSCCGNVSYDKQDRFCCGGKSTHFSSRDPCSVIE